MEQWQGITWQRGRWGHRQWQQLEELLDSGQEFHLLQIQYPYFYYHDGQWYQIPGNMLPDPHWYERAAIQRATYHEGMFSIFLAWEAGFSGKRMEWVWIYPPNGNEQPVNARDFNTLAKKDWVPDIVKTSHGDLLRIEGDTIAFPEYSYHVDPLVKNVRRKDGRDGQTDGGLFIVPPDYQVKLYVNQIRSKTSI